uniref:Uncharacterized protein n=1 Tax=Romanomermis culicivorax TaxID=13658 RepID=A0A915L7Y0_ROMCU
MVLSCSELLDALKPELRQEFMDNDYAKWFMTNAEDKQTPGLLKVEWKGTSMCCLSAKTYISIDQETTLEK